MLKVNWRNTTAFYDVHPAQGMNIYRAVGQIPVEFGSLGSRHEHISVVGNILTSERTLWQIEAPIKKWSE